MLIPRVKICCIGDPSEARTAIEMGAAAIGLVSQMPSGPGVISEEMIALIASHTPPPIATFLLTARQTAREILEQQRRCRTTTLQLVDRVPHSELALLRDALPGIGIVQVIHVVNRESIAEAVDVAPFVDALLLDSGNPALAIKQLGGTGRTHDWSLSREIRDAVPVPVILAGGLTAENVAAAVQAVQPFGIDLCSGVRTEGRLDPLKLDAFMRVARRAD